MYTLLYTVYIVQKFGVSIFSQQGCIKLIEIDEQSPKEFYFQRILKIYTVS